MRLKPVRENSWLPISLAAAQDEYPRRQNDQPASASHDQGEQGRQPGAASALEVLAVGQVADRVVGRLEREDEIRIEGGPNSSGKTQGGFQRISNIEILYWKTDGSWSDRQAAAGVGVLSEFSFESIETGTRMTKTSTLPTGPFLGVLLGRLAGSMFARFVQGALEKFKQDVEVDRDR